MNASLLILIYIHTRIKKTASMSMVDKNEKSRNERNIFEFGLIVSHPSRGKERKIDYIYSAAQIEVRSVAVIEDSAV